MCINAISPLDGRYKDKLSDLQPIVSEYGLMHFRVIVEIKWLQALASVGAIREVPALSEHTQNILNKIIKEFSIEDVNRIKNIEKTTNHDVKAVEYFLKEKIQDDQLIEFIHFGCTSEDINNLAYALMLQTARQQCLLPDMEAVIDVIKDMAQIYAKQPMLSRTHGQPASPTTVGKEMANVAARLASI